MKNKKNKTGYLTGSFDILHYGHTNIIKRAAKKVDKLVVGVHKDGKHKNKKLFVSLKDRISALESLSYVDEVVVSSGRDDNDWIKVKYDFLFVGSDYKGSDRFKEFEKNLKGKAKIKYFPRTKGISSTELRNKLRNKLSKNV